MRSGPACPADGLVFWGEGQNPVEKKLVSGTDIGKITTDLLSVPEGFGPYSNPTRHSRVEWNQI